MEYETFFLQTVWGILILGAAGSILGGCLVISLKKLVAYLSKNKDSWWLSLIYPYRRAAALGQKCEISNNPSSESKYLIYCMAELAGFIFISFCLISTVSLGLLTLLFFGLERPYVLICALSVIILMLHAWFKQGMFFFCLYGGHINEVNSHLSKNEPENYKEWCKKRLSN